ncbi:MAG: M61 family metallopeptidase [Flavobacteriales bacterium]
MSASIQYRISCVNAQQRYIQFSATFPSSQDHLSLHLASWRPGRYELGNFAKNIKGFRVFDEHNNVLDAEKSNKDTWQIQTANTSQIRVEYAYFANELNAGSTYLDDQQLYINPVNCFLFTDESFSYELELTIPSNWEIASSLPFENNRCAIENFDRLADSPLICSAQLEKGTYEVNGHLFHVWFNNQKFIQWEKVLVDFEKFTKAQINDFSEFPAKEFHFLIQTLPYAAYHGVEHLESTVITLGPNYDVFGSLYKELLGVSSHELYHVWNVKSIRPAEMNPYDFKAENYSVSGFVYEGITTYLGDLYLLRSGVFSLEQYLLELSKQLQKHFDNPGRFNYSVGASSFDTWLDGYTPGAPGRKVSIYTEGCLLALVTDVKLREATNHKYGIQEVMKRLYFDFAVKGIGYTWQDYQQILENVSGTSFQDFFDRFVFGTEPYESILVEACESLGFEIKQVPSASYAEAKLGMKIIAKGTDAQILSIYPGSPADLGGLSVNDEILAVNQMRLQGNLDAWLNFYDAGIKTLLINRNGRLIEKTLPEVNRYFYLTHSVHSVETLNQHQRKARKFWGNLAID